MAPNRLTEVRMQATSYRASNAYYVKSDLFIDFKDSSQQLLNRLQPGREAELKDFVAKQYGFAVQPIADDDVRKACDSKPECSKDFADYMAAVEQIRILEGLLSGTMGSVLKGAIDIAYTSRQRILDDLRQRQILISRSELPGPVAANLQNRQSIFASKFDPFRLAIEHAALKNTRLDVEAKNNGKKPYVSFTRLDEDLAPEDKDNKGHVQSLTQELLDKLGFEDMGLIREFDLCRFSFGYSRMESSPILREKRGMDMPVRLNLFPPMKQNDSMRHPVYVIQQGNEALYVRLKEDLVLEWLRGLNCLDMFTLNGDEKIGAGLLLTAQPMSQFLDNLPENSTPHVYHYLYTLLHSFSHLLMKYVSEYSGLIRAHLRVHIS